MRSNQEHRRICREKAGAFHADQWMGEELPGSAEQP